MARLFSEVSMETFEIGAKVTYTADGVVRDGVVADHSSPDNHVFVDFNGKIEQCDADKVSLQVEP